MTLLSSGQLGLQDAGTNPTTNILGSYMIVPGNVSTAAYLNFRTYDPEFGYYYYTNDIVSSGLIRGYGVANTRSLKDTGVTFGYPGTSNGFTSRISDHWLAGQASNRTPGTYTGWYGGFPAITSTIGGINDPTFIDYSGTVRTVSDTWIMQNSNADASSRPKVVGNIFVFALQGNVPNTDSTFTSLRVVNSSSAGFLPTRAGASAYTYDGTNSIWTWNLTDAVITYGNMHASGNIYVDVLQSGNSSRNNGIAEEFGGADNNNVKMSDYYRGTDLVPTNDSSEGIPSSGEIKFSNFYGTQFRAGTLHNTAWESDYNTNSGYFIQSGYTLGATAPGGMTDNIINSTIWGNSNLLITILSNSGGSIWFYISANGTATTFTNSGWTTLKIWTNQTNNTGTPTLTLTRTAMAFGTTNNGATNASANWTQSGSFPTATYFGNTNGLNHYMELI